MGINARKYDNEKSGFTITVQLHYDAEKREEKIIGKNERIWEAFQRLLKKNDDFFKIRNSAFCIAKENNENKEKLYYTNDSYDWRIGVKNIFHNYIIRFLDISAKSINEIVQSYDDNE